MKEFTFLFISKSPVINLVELAKALPKDAELSDGDVIFYWTTKAKTIGTAINRANNKLNAVRESTNLNWELDYEVEINDEGKLDKTDIYDLIQM